MLTSSELRYYIKGQLRGKMRLRDVLSVRALPTCLFGRHPFEVTSEFSQRWMLSTLDATQARDWVRLIRIAVTAKKQHAELKDAEHLDLALRFSEGHACLNKRSRLMQMLNELLSDREIVTETLRGLRSMIKLIHAAMNEPHAMTLSQELPSCKTPTIIAATGAWPFLGLGSWKASDGSQSENVPPAKQNPANTEASFTIAASFLGLAGSITDSGDGFEIRGNGVGYATLASIYGDKIDVRTPLGANERASDVPDIPVDASLRFCARLKGGVGEDINAALRHLCKLREFQFKRWASLEQLERILVERAQKRTELKRLADELAIHSPAVSIAMSPPRSSAFRPSSLNRLHSLPSLLGSPLRSDLDLHGSFTDSGDMFDVDFS